MGDSSSICIVDTKHIVTEHTYNRYDTWDVAPVDDIADVVSADDIADVAPADDTAGVVSIGGTAYAVPIDGAVVAGRKLELRPPS